MSFMRRPRITVVGGGVIGLTSAFTILSELPNCDVTVISEQYTPNTTGDLAGGLWMPIFLGDSPVDDVNRWSSTTWDQLSTWHASAAYQWGVSMVPGVELFSEPHAVDHWSHIVQGYRIMDQSQCSRYGDKYVSGISYTTYFAEPAKFLPKLMEEIKKRGGSFKQRRLATLEDAAAEADVVVNCSGIGAHKLVPDGDLIPIRGQVIRVRAPWVTSFMADCTEDSFAYILPNIDCVVLGGTHEEGNWSLEEDKQTSATILERCCELVPSLKHAEVLGCDVGLRPFRRQGVRLEVGEIRHGGRTVPVVHNYGHGGSGITLMWGCAQQVATLVRGITALYKATL